jgi:hypothetical protein
MILEDSNDEYENSDEDEDGIPLAAVVDDEIEDNRKMPALPAAAGNKQSESSTNKKQKQNQVTMKALNTRKQAQV